MGPVIETAAQPGNNDIANVELIQTQSAPKWTLLSSLMESYSNQTSVVLV